MLLWRAPSSFGLFAKRTLTLGRLRVPRCARNDSQSRTFLAMPILEQPDNAHTLYQAAIVRLNSLQNNAVTIEKLRGKRDLLQQSNIPETTTLMEESGISIAQVNALNVIHVSGTKGKGSSCAFIECLLRSQGYKTGFYSSPHLVHARERIRINGVPISEKHFAESLFTLYDRCAKAVEDSDHLSMPPYFKFLTILAYDIFIKERVDVAIIEVGIGGQYDCTNVVTKPKVTAVTTLDYDHVSLLGSTIREIAWHKAGIFKKNTPAIVSDVTPESFEVMVARAKERESSSLTVCPPLSAYVLNGDLRAGIPGSHQRLNISLALQAVRAWLQVCNKEDTIFTEDNWKIGQPFAVPEIFQTALENCKWPGRSQIIKTSTADFFLDGAHTLKSIEVCSTWFSTAVKPKTSGRKRVLVFHCTADRTPASLLPFLTKHDFDYALFTPTIVSTIQDTKSDLTNFNQSSSTACKRSAEASGVWKELSPNSICYTFSCIQSTIDWINQKSKITPLDVLVTGSLHLVGGVISIIDPQSALPN